MTKILSTCLRIVGVALAIQQVVLAQKCYYPNGAETDTEKPCSSADGSACCPDKWQCLDNGLCYYPPDNLHGRYSCTDKSWKASGCPSNMCTYGMTAPGGEDIRQCSSHDNQWCCNADKTHVHCCDEWPEARPFFALQDGKAYATIGSSTASDVPDLASITGEAVATGAASSKAPSSTPPASLFSSSSPSSNSPEGSSSQSGAVSSATPTPVTSLQTSVSSDASGVHTVVETLISTPPVASSTSGVTPSSPSSSKSKVPVIVGCAVGIPLAIALIGILTWLLRKRHNDKRAPPYSETPDPYTNGSASPEFAGGAKLRKSTWKNEGGPGAAENGPVMPELAGQSVGPGRPVSTIKGRAELDSGAAFVPGAQAPHAPHLVGLGGGNGQGHTPQSSWGSAPPGYSPGMNQAAWAPGHAQMNSVGSMQDGGAGYGGGAGGAVPGAMQTEGGRYVPYRPPQGHPAALQPGGRGGLHNVPEMAEMAAVTTPPAAELPTGRTP